MMAHFKGFFVEVAKHKPKIKEAVGRYFPFLWNGESSWLTLDLKSEKIIFLNLESDEPYREAYASFDDFLEDLLIANEKSETLKFFS